MSSDNILRQLPSVTALLNSPELQQAAQRYGQPAVTAAAREAINELRKQLQAGAELGPTPDLGTLTTAISRDLHTRQAAGLRPVVNATGVLLHTNLGRAPIARQAAEAACEAAASYCNVELDLETGDRSNRSAAVADLLRLLTGAESAHVVNNNAGALGLALGALAEGREIVVSHGELIEIGGGYRLPEVIKIFGARLRAVGSTNKTRVSDYAEAIGPETAVLLAVHPSNYRVSGFTESPRIEDLARLARERNVTCVHDIGSGALVDFGEFGFPAEPVASVSVKAGADLVMFSGDKLLGGPQCGILVGRRAAIERVKQHPLNRALRVDKATLAALRATLETYQHGREARETIPLLKLLTTEPEDLKHRAEKLREQLSATISQWQVEVIEDEAYLGGGTTPEQSLPSWSVALASESAQTVALAQCLRLGAPAVVPRISQGRLILALHSVLPDQDELLVAAVQRAARQLDSQ